MMFEMMIRDLDRLDTEQLAALSGEVARVFNEKNAQANKQFRKGDKVCFVDTKGNELAGTLVRRGKKTFKVDIAGTTWSVTPSRVRSAWFSRGEK